MHIYNLTSKFRQIRKGVHARTQEQWSNALTPLTLTRYDYPPCPISVTNPFKSADVIPANFWQWSSSICLQLPVKDGWSTETEISIINVPSAWCFHHQRNYHFPFIHVKQWTGTVRHGQQHSASVQAVNVIAFWYIYHPSRVYNSCWAIVFAARREHIKSNIFWQRSFFWLKLVMLFIDLLVRVWNDKRRNANVSILCLLRTGGKSWEGRKKGHSTI